MHTAPITHALPLRMELAGMLHGEAFRYGENPQQHTAGMYDAGTNDPLALPRFTVAHGTPSYINTADLDRALRTATHIAAIHDVNQMGVPLIGVVVKHGNACGAATGRDPVAVIRKMMLGNPLAAFGGAVITNFPITVELAAQMLHEGLETGNRRILDVIAAPGIEEDAVAMLRRKDGRGCMFINEALSGINQDSMDADWQWRPVRGGFLQQEPSMFCPKLHGPAMEIFGPGLSAEQEASIMLAWAVGSTSNSNTITLARDGMIIANATGQQDRVGACTLAVHQAERNHHPTKAVKGAVAYSDSFFPFPDGPQLLADHGIIGIMATSGSKNDALTKKVCATHGITLFMTPDIFGRGFFGH